jgi:adenylate cyclase
MAESNETNRRLAAILAADVVGYSRMMGADEAGTLTSLKRHRETVFDPAVAAHKGRVVKLIGDGTLVEFGSVVDAVKCALAIQRAVKAAAGQDGGGITLRIGINLGDVIIDGDDIYGDGVNVAARLEPLASPGGVCVASIVNESIGSRIDVRFTDGGEVAVKNIDRPIRVWKWHPDNDPVAARPAPAVAASGKAPAEQASIAVLPFDNMSGDPEQAYFSDGITEDIITDLSKVAGLMVIARNSSFAYKGKSIDIRTVGRELGVRSVLEGSIRRAGNRVRITAQLINAETGGHVWADRYDRDLTDIFEVQDEVTRHIVDALKVMLTAKEKARLSDDGDTASVEAHDCFLKAREFMSGPVKSREVFDKAREQLERAIQLDPGYGAAYAGLAVFYGFDYSNRWSADPSASLRRADELALQAVALAPNDPFPHYVLSYTAGYSRDFARSRAAVDRALDLNPNYPDALVSRGAHGIFSGNSAEGIPSIELAIRLDPAGSSQYLHFLGLAHLMLGNYETAAAHFRERVRLSPETDLSRALLASALGHLGRVDEARRVWRELMNINPAYSFTTHMNRLPFVNPTETDKIAAGLAKAGLPD